MSQKSQQNQQRQLILERRLNRLNQASQQNLVNQPSLQHQANQKTCYSRTTERTNSTSDSRKPAEPETPKTPEQPTKPIDVVVTPSGEIDKTNQSAGTQPSIPIETSNLAEVTHVPSETTPITTEAGEEIVAVDKGVPLTKTPEGLKPISSSYKVLPSGNVEVKASDGKMKVLPHTGEKFTPFSLYWEAFCINFRLLFL